MPRPVFNVSEYLLCPECGCLIDHHRLEKVIANKFNNIKRKHPYTMDLKFGASHFPGESPAVNVEIYRTAFISFEVRECWGRSFCSVMGALEAHGPYFNMSAETLCGYWTADASWDSENNVAMVNGTGPFLLMVDQPLNAYMKLCIWEMQCKIDEVKVFCRS